MSGVAPVAGDPAWPGARRQARAPGRPAAWAAGLSLLLHAAVLLSVLLWLGRPGLKAPPDEEAIALAWQQPGEEMDSEAAPEAEGGTSPPAEVPVPPAPDAISPPPGAVQAVAPPPAPAVPEPSPPAMAAVPPPPPQMAEAVPEPQPTPEAVPVPPVMAEAAPVAEPPPEAVPPPPPPPPVAEAPQPPQEVVEPPDEALPLPPPLPPRPPAQRPSRTAAAGSPPSPAPPPGPAQSLPGAGPQSPAQPGRAVIEGPTRAAAPLFRPPEPSYPEGARLLNITGTVRVRLEIDETGRVIRVELVQSGGHPALDQAALTYYAKWLWQPAMRNGQPVADAKFASITFRLTR